MIAQSIISGIVSGLIFIGFLYFAVLKSDRNLRLDEKIDKKEHKIKSSNKIITFDRKFKKFFFIFFIVCSIILLLPIAFTQLYFFNLDFTKTGSIGDTIGGITAPFISISVGALTFLAFWVQFKANEQQIEVNNQQKKDLKIERFENKFYEMLRLHRENVSEMNIADKIYGRKCFVAMFYEFRLIYKIVNDYYRAVSLEDKLKYEYNEENLLSLVYSIFFYGIGQNSEQQYLHTLVKGDKHLFNQLKDFLEIIQEKFLSYSIVVPDKKYYLFETIIPPSFKDKKIIYRYNDFEFYYYPFDGHANRLGHYYRHLLQTIQFIDKQEILEPSQKYDYVKMLRVQISNFEQLHIYYNAMAWFINLWRPLIVEYHFLKNLPVSLADFSKTPLEEFRVEILKTKKEGNCLFELYQNVKDEDLI